MSLHPSLKIDTATTQQRTVLTRIERIKDLMKKELWRDDHPLTGLPKTKITRIKAKAKAKEESKEAEAQETAAKGPEAEKPEARK